MTLTARHSIGPFRLNLIVLAILMAACTNNDDVESGKSPSATVSKFNAAILEKDYRRAVTLTDTEEEDYALYEAWLKLMYDEMAGAKLEVLSEDVAADSSSALVRVELINGKTHDTLYTQTVKVGGRWKVSLSPI